MLKFLGLLALILGAVPALAQNSVATCPTATTASAWANGTFLPCATASAYVAVPVPAATVVGVLRNSVGSWQRASAVLATDQVWQKTTAVPTGQWALAPGLVAVATVPPVTPPVTTPPGTGATVTLSWAPPTTNTDGSALTDLASYNILMGTSATALSQLANLPSPASSYSVQGLSPGTYWFAVQSVNAGGSVSVNSNEPSTTVTPPTKTPSAPGAVSVTVTVTVP